MEGGTKRLLWWKELERRWLGCADGLVLDRWFRFIKTIGKAFLQWFFNGWCVCSGFCRISKSREKELVPMCSPAARQSHECWKSSKSEDSTTFCSGGAKTSQKDLLRVLSIEPWVLLENFFRNLMVACSSAFRRAVSLNIGWAGWGATASCQEAETKANFAWSLQRRSHRKGSLKKAQKMLATRRWL